MILVPHPSCATAARAHVAMLCASGSFRHHLTLLASHVCSLTRVKCTPSTSETGDGGGGDGGSGDGGGGLGGGGEGEGEGKAQTSRSSSKPAQPVAAVQPRSSSATVQSLAPAPSQMASAWAKVWSCLQRKASSDPPHTEQSAFFNQVEESWVSEQHRTCVVTGSVEARSVLIQARDGMDALLTHLVQLVHCLEPCSLSATAGTPAHDGGR